MTRLSRRGRWLAALAILLLVPRAGSATTFTGFGDSITYGDQSSWGSGYIGVYAYYVSWEMPGAALKNQGVGGETTSMGLSRLPGAIGGSTHVLIMEGTNDISQGVSRSTIVSNLEAMATYAASVGVVPVIGCPPPRRSSDNRDPGNQTAKKLSADMAAFAGASGYPFAPVFDDFMAWPTDFLLSSDKVHPGDLGYEVLAWSWHKALDPLFAGPSLKSSTPDWGEIGSARSMTLTGAGLASGMAGHLFSMRNRTQPVFDLASVVVTSATQATATVPAALPTDVFDVVLEAGGSGAILHFGYSATGAPPTIGSITPATAPAGQSVGVTITGSNLEDWSKVYFGSTLGTGFLWQSSNSVTVTAPALAAGCLDVRFVNFDRSEATAPMAFCALGPPPSIATVSPPSGMNDAAVALTIAGSNFLAPATVSLGATVLPAATVESAWEIDATVPVGFAEGTYDVSVRNGDGQVATLPSGYTELDATPQVTGINPATVEEGERTAVTITGDHFQQSATVKAGSDALVDVAVVSAQTIQAIVPTSVAAGTYDITVTNLSGQSGSLPAALTVLDSRAPIVALAYPEDGLIGAPALPRFDLWLVDSGAGIDVSTITLAVDGVAATGVTLGGGPRTIHASYRPTTPFPPLHAGTLRVQAQDLAPVPHVLDRTLTFTVAGTVDADGDGLPDDYETAHGLDPASASGASGAAGDPDADAAGNAAELSAGSDPTTPAFLALAPGPGSANAPEVALYLPGGERLDAALTLPYGGYGLEVAQGDVDADGASELLTGPGPSPSFGPQVRAFEANFTPIAGVNFFAYGTLHYGVKVAAGALEGGMRQDVVTGPGPGVVFGPQVRGFRHTTGTAAISKINFYAYGTLKYGVTPGAGELDADGYDEILTAAAAAPVFGPHVRGFSYDNLAITSMGKVSFFAYGTPRFGVNAATGDVDTDGYDEIVTGPGPTPVFAPELRGFNYDGATLAAIPGLDFLAFSGATYGAQVASGDLDGDRVAEIVAGTGAGWAALAHVRTFAWDGSSVTPAADFYAWDGTAYGTHAACGDVGLVP